MSDMKCPFCGQKLGRKNINDRMCSNEKCVSWKGNFYGSEDLWQELIRTKKQLEIYHEFVTKLYLNRNITDKSLIRLQKRLYIQTKGGNNE